MSWWIVLIIALPLLFVVGMVYNALKAQRKLEREMLPEIIREREEERERIRKAGLIAGHAADPEQHKADPWDDDDDWPVRTSAAENSSAASETAAQSAAAPESAATAEPQKAGTNKTGTD